MGLRFKKSISLFPGVKLNFGTTGMSVSTGVRGFRKTFHTSGKVTTSVGIPGTGLYYVDTKNTKKKSDKRVSQIQTGSSLNEVSDSASYNGALGTYSVPNNEISRVSHTQSDRAGHPDINNSESDTVQLDITALKSIHKSSDDSIDWTAVLVSPLPPDETYNQDMWKYYHSMASKVLSGEIDAYLQLIYEVNPLDDLLIYGSNFEFGTDDPRRIEVEFTVNECALNVAKHQLGVAGYNNLLQDYICSVCIRIARDMFALLPIEHVIVHAVLNGNTVVSVDFDRGNLSKVKFGYIDPSNTLLLFNHHMDYSDMSGFEPVTNLE